MYLSRSFWISKSVGFLSLTLSWRRSLSYRNQSIDLRSKSMDWFLYNRDLRHESVKQLASPPVNFIKPFQVSKPINSELSLKNWVTLISKWWINRTNKNLPVRTKMYWNNRRIFHFSVAQESFGHFWMLN